MSSNSDKVYRKLVNFVKRGGLMVVPVSNLDRGHCCVLGQDTLLSQCLSIQVHKWSKWVPVNLMPAFNPAMD